MPSSRQIEERKHERLITEGERTGVIIDDFEVWLQRNTGGDWQLRGLKLRPPKEEGDDWMVIVSTETPEGRFVGFVTGAEMAGVMRVAMSRLMNGTLKLKEDHWDG